MAHGGNADSSGGADGDRAGDADPDADGGDHPDAGARGRAPGRPCPLCGESMYERHCKYVCPRHGVVYDCSDTFY